MTVVPVAAWVWSFHCPEVTGRRLGFCGKGHYSLCRMPCLAFSRDNLESPPGVSKWSLQKWQQ